MFSDGAYGVRLAPGSGKGLSVKSRSMVLCSALLSDNYCLAIRLFRDTHLH